MHAGAYFFFPECIYGEALMRLCPRPRKDDREEEAVQRRKGGEKLPT